MSPRIRSSFLCCLGVAITTLVIPGTASACPWCNVYYYGSRVVGPVTGYLENKARYPQGTYTQVFEHYGPIIAQGIAGMGGEFRYETTPAYIQPAGEPYYYSGPQYEPPQYQYQYQNQPSWGRW